MPIVRLLFISVGPDDADEAIRIWKNDCAPLMISSPGCLSEELLHSLDAPGEFISHSVWQSTEDIERYRVSEAHERIKEHSRHLASGERPRIGLYEVAG